MSDALLLAPHPDDESLFAFYQLLRHQAHVYVLLDSIPSRQAEFAAAMRIAGRSWTYSNIWEGDPKWRILEGAIATDAADYDTLIAPAFEEGGHEHHNRVASIVDTLSHPRVIRYLTYRRGYGRSEGGIKIAASLEERQLKARALNCYVSQRHDPQTAAWFPAGAYGTLDEWIIAA